MPLYEFSCKKCDHTFEELVFDGDRVACPQCHGTKLEKLMSVPGLSKSAGSSLPTSCGDPSLPPCGAPWCQRTG
jgi:putative FmdB family regulatory protein